MGATTGHIDPVTLETVRHGLESLADEMALTVMRTAYSGIVKDALDYSTGFCDRKGQVVAQGLTIVLHLGSFPDAVESILTGYPGDIAPGDVFIQNDPYRSGATHLPDIYIIKPVFVQGELEGFSCVTAHHTDVGGIVPGSNSTNSVEIYQEGLRIPTLKLYDAGKPNETLFRMIETNVRVPDKVLGDIRAEIAAAATGEARFLELAERHGVDTLRTYTEALQDYAERLAKEEIRDLPDGDYEFTSYIDADNIDGGPVVIHVKITVADDELTVDLTGSSPRVAAGINSPIPSTRSACYGAVRQVMDPDIPNCSGYMQCIRVIAPEDSVVYAHTPAACGARGITTFRIMDAIWGALAQAVPDAIPADGEGGNTIIAIGGYDSTHGPFAFVDLFAGARGGRPFGDGPDGVPHPGSNNSNSPVELAEVEYPVRIESYELLRDSGGAGKNRGGLSHVREVRCLADEGTLQLRSDKRAFLPYGLHGGNPGSPSTNVLNPGSDDRMLPTMGTAPMIRGDLIRHVMASGGGWGDPLDRDPERVAVDVRDDKVSPAGAKSDYGVVLDSKSLEVDWEATKQTRRERRQPH